MSRSRRFFAKYGGFCGGAEQSLEAVDDGVLQFGVKFEARIFEESVCELSECLFGIEFELQFEDAFGFSALQCEKSV
jgi:hypothetical protein